MLKKSALLFASVILAAQSAVASVPAQSKTLYELAETSWAVGTMSLGKPMKFRDGQILVFPTQIQDRLWAPRNTKPRSLLLVYEMAKGEEDSPVFHQNDVIFAPIRLLPDHAYWRDNLPNTHRHQVAGGTRYAFRGDEIDEVRRVLGAYFDARKQPGLDRWKYQLRAVASGLHSNLAVVREDSARYLGSWKTLGRDLDATAIHDIAGFLCGDAPEEQKGWILDAVAAAHLDVLVAPLADAVARGDATSRPAGEALARIGGPEAAEKLSKILREGTGGAALAAAAGLGRMGGCAECTAVLREQSDKHPDPAVRKLIGALLEAPAEHKP